MPDTPTTQNPYVLALQDLDAMAHDVADGFETEFLASNLARVAQYGDDTRFSEKQQAVIRRLVETYLSPERAAELSGQQRLALKE